MKIRYDSFLPIITIYIILFIGLYHSTLKNLVYQWNIWEDYNYCFLMPIIIIYVIYRDINDIIDIPSNPSWKGLIIISLGLSLYWIGELAGEYFSQYLSAWLVIIGLCWTHLGWRKIKKIWFPLLLILLMFPLPRFINNRLTLHLRLTSSQIGVWIMHLLGIPAYREGNIIDIGVTKLQVIDACSGLRYVFPLIIMGSLLVYFYKSKTWKRLVIIISTIPLSIITNGLRIALTGILCQKYDTKIIEGFFHSFLGWLIFIFSVLILFLEIKILKFNLSIKQNLSSNQNFLQKIKQNIIDNPLSTSFDYIYFVIILFFFIVTFIGIHTIKHKQQIPQIQPLSHFPIRIGEWRGIYLTMEQKFIKALHLSDYVLIEYHNPQGEKINFYIAYYKNQSKGKSIHSPISCLLGSGWIFIRNNIISISLSGYYKNVIKLHRLYMQKNNFKQLAYYFYIARGRIITNIYHLKFYNFWDALTKHRTDAALVRIITPIYYKESTQDAEIRLKQFTKEVIPIILNFISDNK